MNKGCLGIGVVIAAIAVLALIWGSGVYNKLVSEDENVARAWANVEADYQRRYDLIGNLVATVENAAEFERGTLTDVIEARAKASSINLTANELTPENIQKFQQAQNELNQSFLGRMNFLQENYPQLTATEQFRDLNAQIEGTENRINVSRTRYNEAVNQHNNKVRKVPNNLLANIFGFNPKAPFSSVSGAEVAPSVRDEFNKG
ncbi:LemA family [Candidatus Ornithobacterium hominis]|uniref:LemA family n=1 Tax=Candidatus Ornithobacterium hominis TaxID=2497989 RepID=A0A383TV32_9FLAO|nr:LemA family protein [Candidatus Ornithobacterium hominis]MCT7903864.1 LemA family protein [Candidatus Ornithobacterium hominis]SZD71207.1 LemA family [Candidatus Ornithobacterium hominis]